MIVGVAGLVATLLILNGGVLKEKKTTALRAFFAFYRPNKSKLLTAIKYKDHHACVMVVFFSSVGVAGFEPATPWSQTRCANRTALYPEFGCKCNYFWQTIIR